MSRDSWLVTMCFALSLLGRRALGTASHNNSSAKYVFVPYTKRLFVHDDNSIKTF